MMEKEVINALIDSLNSTDAGWVFTEYMAYNDFIKCEIWLANGLTFLEVKFWGEKIGCSVRKPLSYGGYSVFGFLVPWRWRLYLAASAKQAEALEQKKIKASTIVAAIRSASGAV